MALLKGVERAPRSEVLMKGFVVDTVRGVIRVRKWPRKRGTPKSALQLWWIDWFRQANLLAKYVDAASMRRAIELTAKSGMYPRDILLAAMRGRLYHWYDKNGKRWRSMAAIKDISETLDILTQEVGSILVRAVDRWRAPDPGVLGDVLTNKGVGVVPEWEAPSGGAVQQEISGSPITCDNTQTEYIFDVTGYQNVTFIFDDIDFSTSDRITIRVSTDDGVTYHSGASDYAIFSLTSAGEGAGYVAEIGLSDGGAPAGHLVQVWFADVQAPRTSWLGLAGLNTGSTRVRAGWNRFDGPVTHFKLYSLAGDTFKTGTIHAMGAKAA